MNQSEALKGYPKRVEGYFETLLYCYDKTNDSLFEISISNGMVEFPAWGRDGTIKTNYKYVRIKDMVNNNIVEYQKLKDNYTDEEVVNAFHRDSDLIITKKRNEIEHYRMIAELKK